MKLSILLFLNIAVASSAVPCGKWYTTDCLADSDIRYDASASNKIVDQNEIWAHQAGYWISDSVQYNSEGLYREPKHLNIANLDGSSVPYGWPRDFTNITVTGSRRSASSIIIYPPAPTEFCEEPIPAGLVNVVFGVCGINGGSVAFDSFSTSSYEKDGTIVFLPVGADEIITQTQVEFGAENSRGYAVDERTIYTSTIAPDDDYNMLTSTVVVFLDENYTSATILSDSIKLVPGKPAELLFSTRRKARKVSEEEYIQQLTATYANFSVPALFQQKVPQEEECQTFTQCPKEEDWCQKDPECSLSPYQEPTSQLLPGIIAGICIIIAAIIILALVLYMKWRIEQQKKRFRENFASRVAETINLRASVQMLTPEALATEFERIDNGLHDGGDGYISKEELWEFVNSGKAGAMDQKDFNALFAALDSDNNGQVDFLEFCSFLAVCGEEFEVARKTVADRQQRASGVGLQKLARRVSVSARNGGFLEEDST